MNFDSSVRISGFGAKEGNFYSWPYKLYRDGKVEAKTPKGWMKFNNFDSLKLYYETMRQDIISKRKQGGWFGLRAAYYWITH